MGSKELGRWVLTGLCVDVARGMRLAGRRCSLRCIKRQSGFLEEGLGCRAGGSEGGLEAVGVEDEDAGQAQEEEKEGGGGKRKKGRRGEAGAGEREREERERKSLEKERRVELEKEEARQREEESKRLEEQRPVEREKEEKRQREEEERKREKDRQVEREKEEARQREENETLEEQRQVESEKEEKRQREEETKREEDRRRKREDDRKVEHEKEEKRQREEEERKREEDRRVEREKEEGRQREENERLDKQRRVEREKEEKRQREEETKMEEDRRVERDIEEKRQREEEERKREEDRKVEHEKEEKRQREEEERKSEEDRRVERAGGQRREDGPCHTSEGQRGTRVFQPQLGLGAREGGRQVVVGGQPTEGQQGITVRRAAEVGLAGLGTAGGRMEEELESAASALPVQRRHPRAAENPAAVQAEELEEGEWVAVERQLQGLENAGPQVFEETEGGFEEAGDSIAASGRVLTTWELMRRLTLVARLLWSESATSSSNCVLLFRPQKPRHEQQQLTHVEQLLQIRAADTSAEAARMREERAAAFEKKCKETKQQEARLADQRKKEEEDKRVRDEQARAERAERAAGKKRKAEEERRVWEEQAKEAERAERAAEEKCKAEDERRLREEQAKEAERAERAAEEKRKKAEEDKRVREEQAKANEHRRAQKAAELEKFEAEHQRIAKVAEQQRAEALQRKTDLQAEREKMKAELERLARLEESVLEEEERQQKELEAQTEMMEEERQRIAAEEVEGAAGQGQGGDAECGWAGIFSVVPTAPGQPLEVVDLADDRDESLDLTVYADSQSQPPSKKPRRYQTAPNVDAEAGSENVAASEEEDEAGKENPEAVLGEAVKDVAEKDSIPDALGKMWGVTKHFKKKWAFYTRTGAEGWDGGASKMSLRKFGHAWTAASTGRSRFAWGLDMPSSMAALLRSPPPAGVKTAVYAAGLAPSLYTLWAASTGIPKQDWEEGAAAAARGPSKPCQSSSVDFSRRNEGSASSKGPSAWSERVGFYQSDSRHPRSRTHG
ncbi:unnamed protein product [Closterium sp. Naga37s-1]|nr:unnamed protein product [Closterium sp. Naga37s-1]